MNIRNLDLNLLVLFDALMKERNLTRASARVGLSQSAMSNALARLRTKLDDPLFVRAPRGVEPTERARTLAGPIHEALTGLERALSPEPFDPATTRRAFTVMMNDIHELVLGPPLSARVARVAPGIELRFVQGPSTLPDEALAKEGVDLVVSPLEGGSQRCCQSELYPLSFCSLVRRDHPRIGRTLTLARFLELGHVLVAPRGRPGSIVDEILARKGLSRRVVRVVAHFVSAILFVCRSDHVVTLPSLLGEAMASMLPLRMLRVPLEMPSFVMGQFWSIRSDADPGHRWLRQVIAQTAAEISPGRGSHRVPAARRS